MARRTSRSAAPIPMRGDRDPGATGAAALRQAAGRPQGTDQPRRARHLVPADARCLHMIRLRLSAPASAGLALALGLARAGKRLRVYEQAPELREIGAGVSLSPNAVKGLRYLGVGRATGGAGRRAADPGHAPLRKRQGAGEFQAPSHAPGTGARRTCRPTAPICTTCCATGWPNCSRMRWCRARN